MGIQGNKEPGSLAESGRSSSPLPTNSFASSERHLPRSVPPQRTTEPSTHSGLSIVVLDSDSQPPSEDDNLAPPPFFSPLSLIMSPLHLQPPPIGYKRGPAQMRASGVLQIGESPATQLLSSLDLQLLHSPMGTFLMILTPHRTPKRTGHPFFLILTSTRFQQGTRLIPLPALMD